MTTIMFLRERYHSIPHGVVVVLIIQTQLPDMSALYVLVLASITVAAFFLLAFIWSVRSNQYEDKQGAAMRMLHDDEVNTINQ